jgi:hypothetical protein
MIECGVADREMWAAVAFRARNVAVDHEPGYGGNSLATLRFSAVSGSGVLSGAVGVLSVFLSDPPVSVAVCRR